VRTVRLLPSLLRHPTGSIDAVARHPGKHGSVSTAPVGAELSSGIPSATGFAGGKDFSCKLLFQSAAGGSAFRAELRLPDLSFPSSRP
jgi:hypothetical protein